MLGLLMMEFNALYAVFLFLFYSCLHPVVLTVPDIDPVVPVPDPDPAVPDDPDPAVPDDPDPAVPDDPDTAVPQSKHVP